MQNRMLGVLAAGLALAAAGTVFAQNFGNAITEFRQDNPDSGLYWQNGRLARVYGAAFSRGQTPEASAESFINRFGGMFAGDVGDLRLDAPVPGGNAIQPAVFDRGTGAYRLFALNYAQFADGIPVFRSGLKLTVRNENDYPLVLAASAMRDLRGFRPAIAGGADDARVTRRMQRQAERTMGGDAVLDSEPRYVVWAGIDDMVVEPALGVEFVLARGTNRDGDAYQRRLFIADAATGDILYQESLVHYTDIEGSVSGMATEGWGADICDVESLFALPYAFVRVQGGNSTFADADGLFNISHAGNSPVNVDSLLRGTWFEVFDSARGGGTPLLTQLVTPPGPADFIHSEPNTSELDRAGVNAYYHANVVRDFVLSYVPDYPTIGTQQNFDVNVNINNNCNAFYDGSSINFYTSGGGCSNTANSTVVYHEYGHHLVNRAGSGQGEYGEGMSDCIGVIITDTSCLARGFFNDCNSCLREANNNCQYQVSGCSSCGSAIHSCGRLLSGCVWSLRNELLATNPSTYRDLLANMVINSILLRPPGDRSITPAITIDFLTVDDDDGNINNGTPHYDEIDAGFGAHNMPAPVLPKLAFNYPNGRPDVLSPAGGTSMMVEVEALRGTPAPGTGLLHVDTGSGFQSYVMTEQTDNVYEAVFPASACGSTVRWYVSADTTDGETISDPPSAPGDSYSATSAVALNVAFDDDFNTNQGWTVENVNLQDGPWQRAIPAGGGDRGDPATDFDGSGFCFVTDNADGNSDVDGGPTRLISPLLDLSDSDNYVLSYARWFTNDDRDIDRLDVHISNDGGTSWTLVESLPHFSGWQVVDFNVADFVNPNANVRVRFSATDNPNDSVTEAGIDAVKIYEIVCSGTELVNIFVDFGDYISGTLDDVRSSDNQRYVAQSQFGFSAVEPMVCDVIVRARTSVGSPSTIDLRVEGRVDTPNCITRLRLMNRGTGNFEQVHSFAIQQTDTVGSISDVPAANYVGGAGRIDLSVRTITAASFSVVGFQVALDEVNVAVN